MTDTNTENIQCNSLLCGVGIIAVVISLFGLKKWLAGGWCNSKVMLTGKTAIVTGANTGIGKETARDFVKRGARVIIACRDLNKAEIAAQDIKTAGSGEVVIRHLDLASFKSIRKFCDEILATEFRIDILVNNAGLFSEKSKTEDGYDMTFGTNHLGPFLLTNLLLDKIKQSAPARIVNVSSIGHMFYDMNWDDLNYDKPGSYGFIKAYSQSKLANILFTKELARKLKDTKVTVYCLHPGAVKTELGRNGKSLLGVFLSLLTSLLMNLFSKTAVQGAQTTIYCAVSEEAANETGLYYSDCAPKKPSKAALDSESAKKLWDISMEMVNLKKLQ